MSPAIAFLPARAKLCIASLDDPEIQVRAQYNPKELQIDKQVRWADHKSGNNKTEGKQGEKPREDESDQSDLEFTGGAPRTMTIELLFDAAEVGESIEPDVIVLEDLASVSNPEAPASEERKRRPHHCIIVWGASRGGMRPFRCVIESLSVKYTMWDRGGMPLRATCTIKVKEANKIKGSREPKKEYGEAWRDPRWQRRSEPQPSISEVERRRQEEVVANRERYMRALAARRDKRDPTGTENNSPFIRERFDV